MLMTKIEVTQTDIEEAHVRLYLTNELPSRMSPFTVAASRQGLELRSITAVSAITYACKRFAVPTETSRMVVRWIQKKKAVPGTFLLFDI